jgi:hypothetical protein
MLTPEEGFVIVGHVMFGHLYPPMSTIDLAAVECFFWLVGYDPVNPKFPWDCKVQKYEY